MRLHLEFENETILRPTPDVQKLGAMFAKPEIAARYSANGKPTIAPQYALLGRHFKFEQA